jgi:hypothetical protein
MRSCTILLLSCSKKERQPGLGLGKVREGLGLGKVRVSLLCCRQSLEHESSLGGTRPRSKEKETALKTKAL